MWVISIPNDSAIQARTLIHVCDYLISQISKHTPIQKNIFPFTRALFVSLYDNHSWDKKIYEKMLPTINISWPSLDLILSPYNRGPRLGVGTRWWFQISVSLGRQHDDIIKWKHFPRYWPFMRGIHWSLPSQRPVTRSFDVFFSLRLNKQLSKQSWGLWFETP